jgi:hypothetical protein
MKIPLYLFAIFFSTAPLHAQEEPKNIAVNLEGATFVSATDAASDSDPFFNAGQKDEGRVSATFKSSNGITYQIDFPAGISEKIIRGYVAWKKTFYVDSQAVDLQVRNFFLEENYSEKFQARDLYELTAEQKQQVQEAFQKKNNVVPLRGQLMGKILSFVYESNAHS